MIIDRGRGLEEDESIQDVAKELRISEEMVKIAREYIENNKEQVTLKYNQITNRVRETSNPSWLEERISKRMAELRQRIREAQNEVT